LIESKSTGHDNRDGLKPFSMEPLAKSSKFQAQHYLSLLNSENYKFMISFKKNFWSKGEFVTKRRNFDRKRP